MHLIKPITFLLLPVFLFASCKTGLKYNYAIRDFRQALQPALTEIVSKGIVGYGKTYEFLDSNATDGDLEKLSYSEHPVLRAAALRLMTKRPNIDNFTILMNRLDDTAIVAVDNGEFGIGYEKIADDLIDNSKWKTVDDKNKTIDEVITRHNSLSSAYYIVYRVQPKAIYYPFIKQMLNRERKYAESECALFALARYKKKEDVTFIKEFLLEQRHNWQMGYYSFRLMEDYPDTAYFEVLAHYVTQNLYKDIQHGNLDNASQCLKILAGYKTQKSADILTKALVKRTNAHTFPDTAYMKKILAEAIYDNKCPAYSKLEERIKRYIPQIESEKVALPYSQNLISRPETDSW